MGPVILLLPGGVVLDDRATAVESMSGLPCSSSDLEQVRVVDLGPAAAAVVYASPPAARRPRQRPGLREPFGAGAGWWLTPTWEE